MKHALAAWISICICALVAQAGTRADLSGDSVVGFATTMDMPLMDVGNAGNTGDTGVDGCGGVGYAYAIGKFEVTAGQYAEFLNAVAVTDSYALYNAQMWSHDEGCKIAQAGSDGSYSYSVAADWEDRPVNFVSWGDAARFANWLTNGMPTGGQTLATTEDGSYFLNGATSDAALLAVTREADAQFVIPSEDEWYKAAYHKNDGATGNYFSYPTSSDVLPNNDLVDPDPGNNANYEFIDLTIGSPYYRTEVGEFELSESPYETYDMGGNVWEWHETLFAVETDPHRGFRGGSYNYIDYGLTSADRNAGLPTLEESILGFRIAEVPEPATMGLLAAGGLALLGRRKS
jgi:formylglycine-generating enzyme